jgi:hypothetical protein
MVTECPKVSLPVKRFNSSAPALEKTLWPETCSAKGGVRKVAGP